MWDRIEVKNYGKSRFKANYWKSVLCAFLISLVAGGTTILSRFNLSDTDIDAGDESMQELTESFNDAEQALSSMPDEDQAIAAAIVFGLIAILIVVFAVIFIVKIFILNPLQVGCYGFFRENAKGFNADLDIIKSGFTNYGHTFVTLLLKDIFQALWTLLFIVPGIIKAYSYRMVPFILRDNPELSATEVITASRKMMDGQKWNMFVFDLSYIGWMLLGAITCGLVNVFWTEPYRQNANAAIYLKLIGEERIEPEVDIPVYPVSSAAAEEPEINLELEPAPEVEPETDLEPNPEIKLELDSTLETEVPEASAEPEAPETPAEPKPFDEPETE